MDSEDMKYSACVVWMKCVKTPWSTFK